MLRRLTALLASLALVPSMLLGGGPSCVVDGREGAPGAHHGAHHGDTHAVSHQADGDAPAELPHAPAQCVSVASCGVAVAVAQAVQFDTPPHGTARVPLAAALAPDSPALGLEPPPPRA